MERRRAQQRGRGGSRLNEGRGDCPVPVRREESSTEQSSAAASRCVLVCHACVAGDGGKDVVAGGGRGTTDERPVALLSFPHHLTAVQAQPFHPEPLDVCPRYIQCTARDQARAQLTFSSSSPPPPSLPPYMPTFDSLPAELRLHVLRLASDIPRAKRVRGRKSWSERYTLLRSAALVCRAWSAPAQQLLWEVVEVRDDIEAEELIVASVGRTVKSLALEGAQLSTGRAAASLRDLSGLTSLEVNVACSLRPTDLCSPSLSSELKPLRLGSLWADPSLLAPRPQGFDAQPDYLLQHQS